MTQVKDTWIIYLALPLKRMLEITNIRQGQGMHNAMVLAFAAR